MHSWASTFTRPSSLTDATYLLKSGAKPKPPSAIFIASFGAFSLYGCVGCWLPDGGSGAGTLCASHRFTPQNGSSLGGTLLIRSANGSIRLAGNCVWWPGAGSSALYRGSG